MARDQSDRSGRFSPSRRQFLLGGAVAGVGAAAAVGADFALRGGGQEPVTEVLNGNASVPFFGVNQAGVETPPQAHATFVALDLLPDTDRGALGRMMRILTDDAARLTQGRAALADSET